MRLNKKAKGKHQAVKGAPNNIEWERLGPEIFVVLSRALEDHDSVYDTLPFYCVAECWSHDARKLIEG